MNARADRSSSSTTTTPSSTTWSSTCPSLGADGDGATKRRGRRRRRGGHGPDGVLVSPGPGHPRDAGNCVGDHSILRRASASPCSASVSVTRRSARPSGRRVARARVAARSLESRRSRGHGRLRGVTIRSSSGRYHSLVVGRRTADGVPRDRALQRPDHGHAPPRPCRSRVCSSIPSRSSPRTATSWWPTGSRECGSSEALETFVGALSAHGRRARGAADTHALSYSTIGAWRPVAGCSRSR